MEKALKVIDRIVSILASILFILLLVCISVLPIAKSKSYYMNQHHKNDVVGILNEYTFNGKKHYQAGENGEVFEYYYPDDYEATWDDVEKATEHIIDYLYHKDVESMQFQIEHEGKKYDFFTNQAIVHMVDVKVLFIGGINLCYLCIVLFVLCVAYLIYRRHFIKEYIVKTYLITVGVFFIVVLAAIIFAATVGLAPDRLVARNLVSSPTRALVFDAIGAERIESLCDAFCEDIKAKIGNEKKLRPRFSAGYGDLDIEVQRDIFRLLDCPKNIGLTLTESLLMTPSKSVTAIIGIF